MSKAEKIYYLFLIILAILIISIQIGIAHGRSLQIQDIRMGNDYLCSN